MRTYFNVLVLLIASLFLVHCRSTPMVDVDAPPLAQEAAAGSQAALSEQQTKQLRQLSAMIDQHQLVQASQYVVLLQQQAWDRPARDYLLLQQARLARALNQAELTLKALNQLSADFIKGKIPREMVLTLKRWAYFHNNQALNSAIAGIALDTLLAKDSEIKEENRHAIWRAFDVVSAQSLRAKLQQTQDPTLQAWLSFVLLQKTAPQNNQALRQAIDRWDTRYGSILPVKRFEASNLKQMTPLHPKKIVALLPQTGPYKAMSEAIKHGLMDAYYQSEEPRPSLAFIDTSNTRSIKQSYQQAIDQGADLVIGPLSKAHVATLAQNTTFVVPTLNLNYSPLSTNIDNLFQFGLSPNDEAEQIATYAWLHGQTRALIISTNTVREQAIEQSFLKTWTRLGGTLSDQYKAANKATLAQNIAKLLNVDSSQWRHYLVQKTLNEKVQSTAARRKDFDMIFLLGTASFAREVKPMLKFYYTNTIPVYTLSSIYNGHPNTSKNTDLDGILFTDMPWVIQPSPTMQGSKKNLAKLWPKNFSDNTRLYALGYDAYHLAFQLQRLQHLPQMALHAASGNLSLKPNHQLYRQLMYAQFIQGKAQLQS
jgi:outer membrane PBP1 activator LpoA protein